MLKIFCLLASLVSLNSIYDYSVTGIDGNTINLSQFSGKKMLIVNTASTSNYTNQYKSLEQLHQKYKDSLVIIAFPSNSFGHEVATSAEIKQFVSDNYHVHFLIAQKVDVAGDGQNSLYGWLTHFVQNGAMDNRIKDDFYKFLIDGSGNLIGAFAPSVDPLNEQIKNAIENR